MVRKRDVNETSHGTLRHIIKHVEGEHQIETDGIETLSKEELHGRMVTLVIKCMTCRGLLARYERFLIEEAQD